MKTCNEIIDETLAAGYTLSKRAMDSFEGCKYISAETGLMCAVGRCCIAPQSEWYGNFAQLRPSQERPMFESQDRDELLRPEYRGHDPYFWMELQALHDTDRFWTDSGLSQSGQIYVAELKKTWGSK
jgi:hypothetical protein